MSPTLLSLSPDLLRATALWLPPADRLNLALTCRYLYGQIWGPEAIRELNERYPQERNMMLTLCTTVQSDPPFAQDCALRVVPQRMRQQHVSVALTSDAAHVALLPYDNCLRLLSLKYKRVDFVHRLDTPVYTNDVWDLSRGRRTPTPPRDLSAVYADEAGLDVEVTMEFSADDGLLLVSGPRAVSLFARVGKGLRHVRDVLLDEALVRILGTADRSKGVGGGAALSPGGGTVAWVVYSGSPASVYVTFWDVESGECRKVCEVATIQPRRWAALGWGRVVYVPNGRYLLVVVNAAKKVMRMERVGGEFRRIKRCRYVLAVFDVEEKVVRERCEWLELDPKVYAGELARVVAGILGGLRVLQGFEGGFGEEVGLGRRWERGVRSLTLNCLHSCPAEATYKGLSFGSWTRHPWFIIKQPMYSLHFDGGGRICHVATSPHANRMLCLRAEGWEEGGGAVGGWRKGPGRRKTVFRLLPWRSAFACVTAFSSSGEWVVGACLLDDDRCVVSLRNMTTAEYFGE